MEIVYNIAKHCKSLSEFNKIMDEEGFRVYKVSKQPDKDKVLTVIANRYHLKLKDVKNTISQEEEIIGVKRIYCYIMRNYYKQSHRIIGDSLKCSHANALTHAAKCRGTMDVDKEFKKQVEYFNFMKPYDNNDYGNGRLKAFNEIELFCNNEIDKIKEQPETEDVPKTCTRTGLVRAYLKVLQKTEVVKLEIEKL